MEDLILKRGYSPVGSLLVVYVADVPLQVGGDGEGAVAVLARVRLLPRVSPEVSGEVGGAGEDLDKRNVFSISNSESSIVGMLLSYSDLVHFCWEDRQLSFAWKVNVSRSCGSEDKRSYENYSVRFSTGHFMCRNVNFSIPRKKGTINHPLVVRILSLRSAHLGAKLAGVPLPVALGLLSLIHI